MIKRIKGTNIIAKQLSAKSEDANEAARALFCSVRQDIAEEVEWLASLRQDNQTVSAASAFLQASKELRPAIDFCTFNAKKAKSRRIALQKRQRKVTEQRKMARQTSSVALKSALDPRKVPGDAARAPLASKTKSKSKKKGDNKNRRVQRPEPQPLGESIM